jgi:hypothetical protein
MKCIIDNCDKKCINGHTLTKGIITKDLKENINKNDIVYTYDPIKNEFKNIGWKKASTFKFTCSDHDRELFLPIENNIQIDIENLEHLFLHTFRSFSYVYNNELVKLNLNHKYQLDDVYKFSFNDNNQLTYNNIIITNHDVWFQNFIKNKKQFIDSLNCKNYKDCNYITFTINKNIGISGCGILHLPFVCMSGGLNFISREDNTPLVKNPMSILTLLSKGDKTYIILSFNNDNNTEMSLRQLLTIDFNYQDKFNIPGRNNYPIHFNIDNFQDDYSIKILDILSKLISKSCSDNIYIKPSVYFKDKDKLTNLFNNKNFNMDDYLRNNINIFTL